ncbi:hypothetical protein A3Q56_04927, partial [Intoshia linei]
AMVQLMVSRSLDDLHKIQNKKTKKKREKGKKISNYKIDEESECFSDVNTVDDDNLLKLHFKENSILIKRDKILAVTDYLTERHCIVKPIGNNILKKKCIKNDNYVKPITSKKSVKFADECGFTLSTLHIYEKPIYNIIKSIFLRPAIFQDSYITDDEESIETVPDRKENNTEKNANSLVYKLTNTSVFTSFIFNFKPPVSNYATFRKKLFCSNVSLENIFFNEHYFSGTVKVMNIDFKKCVSIIYTVDNWKNNLEIPAYYVYPSDYNDESFHGPRKNMIDTFSFRFSIKENEPIFYRHAPQNNFKSFENNITFNVHRTDIIERDYNNIEQALMESIQFYPSYNHVNLTNSKTSNSVRFISLGFAIKYTLPDKNLEFWDNNDCKNYAATGITHPM